MKKITKILLIVTTTAVAVGFFYYYRNIFSQDSLRFEIDAVESVETGERMDYMIRYRNNGDTRLEDLYLVFEYPENAIPLDGSNEDIIKRGEFRREIDLGELNPGEEGMMEFGARLLGKERDSLEASAKIRYRPKNLTAQYEEERTHITRIESVPITLGLGVPSSVKPKSEFIFRLDYSSQIETTLTDLEVRFNYPSNFQFVSSRPRTDAENKDTWSIPVLNENEEGFIEIDGVLEGSTGDAKVFTATLGVWRNNRFIPLKEASRGTFIAETALFVDLLINGSENYIASPGEMLHYEVFFRNLGEETIENLFILVDLDKNIIDAEKTMSQEGRVSMNSVIWSYTFRPELRFLGRNEEMSVEFWTEVKEDGLPLSPEARTKVSVDQIEATFINDVNTKFSLEQKVVFKNTPFDVEKPVLLEGGDTFNYAVKWNIKNHFTDAENIVIKTTLPQNVDFVGGKDTEKGSFSFNSSRREIIFEIDELYAEESEEIFFEMKITLPEDLDVEEEIRIVSVTEITGKDKRTKQEIKKRAMSFLLKDLLEIYYE